MVLTTQFNGAASAPIPDKQQASTQPWHHGWQASMQSIYAQLFTMFGRGFKPNKPSPFVGLDAARWFRETMAPRDYMNGEYYQYWLTAVCSFIHDHGAAAMGIDSAELIKRRITTSQQLRRNAAIRTVAFRQAVPGVEGPTDRAALAGSFSSIHYDPAEVGSIEAIGQRARFKVGDRVRVKRLQGNWHTRCYPYIRGCEGTIQVYYGLSEEKLVSLMASTTAPIRKWPANRVRGFMHPFTAFASGGWMSSVRAMWIHACGSTLTSGNLIWSCCHEPRCHDHERSESGPEAGTLVGTPQESRRTRIPRFLGSRGIRHRQSSGKGRSAQLQTMDGSNGGCHPESPGGRRSRRRGYLLPALVRGAGIIDRKSVV